MFARAGRGLSLTGANRERGEDVVDRERRQIQETKVRITEKDCQCLLESEKCLLEALKACP